MKKVALSVGVQKMVRSDKASSGVIFTLNRNRGSEDIVHISGVWGLGENIVQGTVTPDEFFVFKPTLLQGKKRYRTEKNWGGKQRPMIYSSDEEKCCFNIDTPKDSRKSLY
jgi:pyruvate,water dikinase